MVNQRNQMRRHAQKMRRYGIQPMTVISPGDTFPDIAAVLFGRWLWRYRSELAPVAVVLALAGVSSFAHVRYSGCWPVIAAAAVPVGTALALGGARFGLATRAERVYAATVVAAMAGWLAASIAVGPFRPPTPQILAAGAPVLALPWWAHRRRRAKVRVERTLSAWPEVAQAVGLAGSRVQSAVGGRVGMAGPIRARTRADHRRRDRSAPGDRVRARNLPGRGAYLPDTRRQGQPVRAARARQGPAR